MSKAGDQKEHPDNIDEEGVVSNGDHAKDIKEDFTISVEDIIPLQLGKTQNDVTDAKTEEPPALPPKQKDGAYDIPPPYISDDKASAPEPEEKKIHSAGSVLELSELEDKHGSFSPGDKEIPISHILGDVSVHEDIPSESVKAFFGTSSTDTVDAATETTSPIPTFEYNMNFKHRGVFVIFNQINFQSHLGMNKRKGTTQDATNLERTARLLGFEYVKTYHDYSFKKIMKLIKQLSAADHSLYDCFALAILTHGDEGDMLYAYDTTFHLDELTEPFMANNCPSLAGKPKLFFIQACRGQKLDHGSEVFDTVDASLTEVANKTQKEFVVIPNAADFLLAFSTVPGYYAWRNQSCGSWFVQALCKCLREFGHRLEIMQVMTRVNRMVAYDFMSYSKSNMTFHGKKQIPSIVTRLTHEVFFRSKKSKIQRDASPRREGMKETHV